jgi:hypothetical protein
MTIQSIIFYKSTWTMDACISYLKSNKYLFRVCKETDESYSFRQVSVKRLELEGKKTPRLERFRTDVAFLHYEV